MYIGGDGLIRMPGATGIAVATGSTAVWGIVFRNHVIVYKRV